MSSPSVFYVLCRCSWDCWGNRERHSRGALLPWIQVSCLLDRQRSHWGLFDLMFYVTTVTAVFSPCDFTSLCVSRATVVVVF